MAGYRRRRLVNGAAPVPLRVGRPARRRAELAAGMATAHTPAEQYTAASSYLRSALGRRHPDPEKVAKLVSDHVEATIELGDELLEMQARERLHVHTRPAS